MNQQDNDTAVAAFIRANGVTRCPTVCVSATRGSISEADRMALRQLDEAREARRAERKLHKVAVYRFGNAA